MVIVSAQESADLANERRRQVTTARANRATGLTNVRAANWVPEIEFSPFCALSRRQMTCGEYVKKAHNVLSLHFQVF